MRIKKLAKCKRVLEVEVPADVVAAEYEAVYAEIAKTAQVPGFRPGKVPVEVLKVRYADAAKEEVLRRLIPLHYAKSLKESGLASVGHPQVSDVKMEVGGPLSFSASLDIRPEVKTRSYKGIALKRRKAQVKEEEIDKVVELLRQRNAEYVTVGDRPAAAGDIAICDVESTLDGKEQKKQEKAWIEADEKKTLPEIARSLIGAKPNEEKRVEFTLPENFVAKEYAGKPAKFVITVFEIKERRLPELSDEFAKSVGNYASLSELREKIKEGLKTKLETEVKLDLESQILEKLLKSADFDLPESLVEMQRNRLYQQMVSDLKMRGVKEEEIKKNEKSLQEKSLHDAERSVKIYFILEDIAQRESIKVNPDEAESEMKSMAQRTGQTYEEVKKYVDENDLLDSMILEIRERKTLEFLAANAKVEDAA